MSDDAGARVRAFLAVELAADVHAAVAACKRELARADPALRWVRDENLHATVKFLGAVPVPALPALRDALGAALGATPPPLAVVRGIGAAPDLRRPRIVWAGIDCAALAPLAATVDAALAPLGLPPETRPFHAHVTLGRVGRQRPRPGFAALLRAHADDAFGSCPLRELVAFRSDLRRDGAVYTKLWTIPFGG